MRELLSGGYSGSRVERFDDVVMKTGPSVRKEALWYDRVRCNVPHIYCVTDDMLLMEYVPRTRDPRIEEILAVQQTLRLLDNGRKTATDRIVERIQSHVSISPNVFSRSLIDGLIDRLWLCGDLYDSSSGFAHGDFSISNILCNDSGLLLIDPIYSSDAYSGWIDDMAKLMMSIEMEGVDKHRFLYEGLQSFTSDIQYEVDLLMAYNAIRILKYRKTEEEKYAVAEYVEKKLRRLL